jgi:hypothetical protein
MCLEAMLGISLYSYFCLKLAKTLCLSYYFLCFLFNKIREQEGGTGSAWKPGVNKCKNNKIKKFFPPQFGLGLRTFKMSCGFEFCWPRSSQEQQKPAQSRGLSCYTSSSLTHSPASAQVPLFSTW